MKELRELLTALGCDDVATYIQSGNAVFNAEAGAGDLSSSIAKGVQKRFGFEPRVLVLTADRLREIAVANPYRDLDSDPKSVHVSFLAEEPANPDLDALTEVKSPTEDFELADGAFYLYAPDGIARSKLAARTEQHLGVAATARNLRTVNKLLDLV
jgi:uncharacterized protein (DUF1697 family)